MRAADAGGKPESSFRGSIGAILGAKGVKRGAKMCGNFGDQLDFSVDILGPRSGSPGISCSSAIGDTDAQPVPKCHETSRNNGICLERFGETFRGFVVKRILRSEMPRCNGVC